MEHFVRSYTTRKFVSCRLVTHGGIVVCFALGELSTAEQNTGKTQLGFFYTILDFNGQSNATSTATDIYDSDAWLFEPVRVPFPREVRYVGADVMPTALLERIDARGEVIDAGTLYDPYRTADVGLYRSSTALLTAQDVHDFQVLSDGNFIYLFRQSCNSTEAPKSGTSTLVNSNLLCDRYSLLGHSLYLKRENRYKSSGRKGLPAVTTRGAASDEIDLEDHSGHPFYEATTVLDFVTSLQGGRFHVLRLPGSCSKFRWNILAFSSKSKDVHSYVLEQAADGGFSTSARNYFTCTSEQHGPAYFPAPGTCSQPIQDQMRCGQVLVPMSSDIATSKAAVRLGGQQSKSSLEPGNGPIQLHDYKGFTLEFWVQPQAPRVLADASVADDASRDAEMMAWMSNHATTGNNSAGNAGNGANGSAPGNDKSNPLLNDSTNQPLVTFTTNDSKTVTLLLDKDGRFFLDRGLTEQSSSISIQQDTWSHVAIVYSPDPSRLQLVVNGVADYAAFDMSFEPVALQKFGQRESSCYFTGALSEIRLWSIILDPLYIKLSMKHRSPGLHEKLLGCWRCDEGEGTSLHDLSGGSTALSIKRQDPQPNVSINSNWTISDAGLSDLGGLSHAALRLTNIAYPPDGGLSACVYYTQDNADTVMSLNVDKKTEGKSNKRMGRIVLCYTVNDGKALVLLDYALSDTGHIAALPGTVSLPTKQLSSSYVDTDENNSACVLDLDLVHLDPSGMTVHGLVLELASPIGPGVEVTESAMGRVYIHFAASDGQLSCLQYDTCLAYEPLPLETVKTDGSKGNQMLIFPKTDALKTLEILISDNAILPVNCVDLSIKATSSLGGIITEQWKNLPRDVEGLLECLRGSSTVQELGLATAVPAQDALKSSSWTVVLNAPLAIPLQTGYSICLGKDWAFSLLKDVKKGDTSLSVRLYKGAIINTGTSPPTFLARARALSYDVDNLVTSPGREHSDFSQGSHLIGFLCAGSDALIKTTAAPLSFKLTGLQRRLVYPLQTSPPNIKAGYASCFIDKTHKSSGGQSMAAELWFRQKWPPNEPSTHSPTGNLPSQTLLYYYDQGVVGLPALEKDVEQKCIVGMVDDAPVPSQIYTMEISQPLFPRDKSFRLQSNGRGVTIEFWFNYLGRDLTPRATYTPISFAESNLNIMSIMLVPFVNDDKTFLINVSSWGTDGARNGMLLNDVPYTYGWHHYAFVIDCNSQRPSDGSKANRGAIYIDGRLRHENWDGHGEIDVGHFIVGQSWKGTLSGLRVWEKAQSERDIRSLMGRTVPPERREHLKVALEEGGTEAQDFFDGPVSVARWLPTEFSQYPSDKTLFAAFNSAAFQFPDGMAAWDNAWHHLALSEWKGRAVSLNGRSHHLRVEHNSSFENLRDMSISLSVEITAETSNDFTILITKADGNTTQFELRRLRNGQVQSYFTASGETKVTTFDSKIEVNKAYHLFFSRKASAKPMGQQGWDHALALDLVVSAENPANGSDKSQRRVSQRMTESTNSSYDTNKAALLIGGGNKNSGAGGDMAVDKATAMHLAWIRLYRDTVDFNRLASGTKDNLTAEWTFDGADSAKIPEANAQDMTAYIEPSGEKFALSRHSDDTLLEVTYDGKPVKNLRPLTKISLDNINPIPGPESNQHRQITLGSGCRDPSQQQRQWFPSSPDDLYLDEVRIWRHGVSRPEILSAMYCPYQDAQQEMAAYYHSHALNDNTWADASGSNRNLNWSGPQKSYTDLLPPLALRPPVVQDILGMHGQPGLTFMACKTSSTPTFCEYGAAVQGTELTGSWNGALAWVDQATGAWCLRTSFRIGRLNFDWMCDVSTGNTLVGYVEGAPPIAGENYPDLSRHPAPHSMVSFGDQTEVTTTWSSRTDHSADKKLDASIGGVFEWDVRAGLGVESELTKGHVRMMDRLTIDATDSKLNNFTCSNSESEKFEIKHECSGVPLNGRQQLANWGTAYIKGHKAAMYALRLVLRGRQPLVAYKTIPPAKPQELNKVIYFKLNKHYTKQGTLDGRDGLEWDIDYRAVGAGAPERSYYRPKEEMQLRAKIDAARSKRQTEDADKKKRLQEQGKDMSDNDFPKHESGSDGMYNTYNWAPKTMKSSSRTESNSIQEEVGGIWRSSTAVGFGFSAEALFSGVGMSGQLDLTGTITDTKTLTYDKTTRTTYELHADVATDVDILDRKNPNNIMAGAVTAYSFTTFYLQEQAAFDFFFNKVVDPEFLADVTDLTAGELRDAQGTGVAKDCWRIFHRVSTVTRQMPPVDEDLPADDLPAGVDIYTNSEIVRDLLPYLVNVSTAHMKTPSDLLPTVSAVMAAKYPMLEYPAQDPALLVIAKLLASYLIPS